MQERCRRDAAGLCRVFLQHRLLIGEMQKRFFRVS
jgi:hypothetical protein